MGIVLPCYVKKSTNKGHPRGTKGARCSAHACSCDLLIYMFPTRYTNTSRLEAAQRESERERKLALVKLISR